MLSKKQLNVFLFILVVFCWYTKSLYQTYGSVGGGWCTKSINGLYGLAYGSIFREGGQSFLA